MTLKVLVSGAGIAGSAAAFWLSKIGHDVTVIERFPSLRVNGLQIDLRGHGIEVMRRMGLEEAFRKKQAPEQGLQIVDRHNRRWAYFPVNKSGKGRQNFTTDFEIMRGDLCRLLHDAAVDRGAKYQFGTTITAFKNLGTCVEVQFANGTTGQYDVLVGADGAGSQVRKMMVGSGTPDPFHPIGKCLGYFTMPCAMQEGEGYDATIFTGTGSRGLMLRRHSPSRIQVYVTCDADSEHLLASKRGDVEKEKAAVAEFYRGAGWRTEEILKGLAATDDFYLERTGYVKMDSWSRGRVVLVGDAGYCPTASTGMGTTSAIVGAYILAGEIARATGEQNTEGTEDSLVKAFKAYDQKFRPFMTQVQEDVVAGKAVWDYLPTSTLGIAAMNALLGLAALLRLNVIAEYVMKEKIDHWDLPNYSQLS